MIIEEPVGDAAWARSGAGGAAVLASASKTAEGGAPRMEEEARRSPSNISIQCCKKDQK